MKYNFNPTTGKLDQVVDTASEVNIVDAGGYYTGTEVETALQEIGDGTALDARYLMLDASNDPVTGVLTLSDKLELTSNTEYVDQEEW